jgi:hypothetical protein
MAVSVVYEGPRRPAFSGLGRGVAVLLGCLLLIIALLALALAALVVPVLVFGGGPDSSDDAQDTALTAGASLVVALVCLPLAIRLLRGKRRLVLFLRRFGFADATSTVTFAAANVIGRSWRLVTLDDERIQPLGGSRGPRRVLGITMFVLLAALALGAYWYLNDGPGRVFESAADSTDSGGEGGLGEAIGEAIAAAIVAVLVLIVIFALAAVVGVSSLFSLFSYAAARRGERAKSALIRTESDVATQGRKVDRRSGRIFAPRLTVVRVADPVWQAAVREFAERSDAVIVDVSVASDNLLWELRTLLPILGDRCVLVGRYDLLTTTTPDGKIIFNPALGRELDGRTVLGYGTSRQDVRRFARALERFLAATARAHV